MAFTPPLDLNLASSQASDETSPVDDTEFKAIIQSLGDLGTF